MKPGEQIKKRVIEVDDKAYVYTFAMPGRLCLLYTETHIYRWMDGLDWIRLD